MASGEAHVSVQPWWSANPLTDLWCWASELLSGVEPPPPGCNIPSEERGIASEKENGIVQAAGESRKQKAAATAKGEAKGEAKGVAGSIDADS